VVRAIDVRGMRSDGYSFQLETALQTWLLGFCVAEVPITFVERVAGASKISRRIIAEAMVRVLAWAVRCLPARLRGVTPHDESVRAGR
jgi:hypothetical protein